MIDHERAPIISGISEEIVEEARNAYKTLDRRARTIVVIESAEVQKEEYILALKENGIVDYGSLMNFGLINFRHLKFKKFRSAKAFVESVTNRKIEGRMKLEDLDQMAKNLGLKLIDDERQSRFIAILKAAKIKDRTDLINFGPAEFNKKNEKVFAEFESGIKFYKAIFGTIPGRYLILDDLHDIADALGFPRCSKKEIVYKAMRRNGIRDKFTLNRLGPKRFAEKYFHPIGKGCRLAGMFFERSFRKVSSEELNLLAEGLNLPDFSRETMECFYLALANNGIKSREDLESTGSRIFRNMEFTLRTGEDKTEKMKGGKFLAMVLQMGSINVTQSEIDELGKRLRLPEKTSEKRPIYYDVHTNPKRLNGHTPDEIKKLTVDFLIETCDVYDLEGLIKKGAHWFEKKKFKNIGSEGMEVRGIHIASIVLGEPVYQITSEILKRIGEKLGFE